MYSKLRILLLKCSFHDLKTGLGEEIMSLAEYLTPDLTPKKLVDIAISGYGKSLLEKIEVRYILLVNTLNPDKIFELAKRLKIPNDDAQKVASKIACLPFRNNVVSCHILDMIGLDDIYLPEGKKDPEERIERIEKQNSEIFYELLDYQYDIRRRLISFYREQQGARSLIHMPTGSGKTKTAMHILQELWSFDYNNKGFILWLAHSEELLRQAIDSFKSVWRSLGAFSTDIVKLWGEFGWEDERLDGCIIFASIQKLQSMLRSNQGGLESISQGLNIIVVDECHKAPATKTHELLLYFLHRSNISGKIPNLLGLTATPGRKGGYDVEDRKLRMLFDNVKLGIDVELMNKYEPGYTDSENEIELLQKRKILSTFDREPIEISAETLRLSPREINDIKRSLQTDGERKINAEIICKIANNKTRNNLILEKLFELNTEGIKTIFFACNVAHAKLINAALRLNNIDSGLILGETTSDFRGKLINRFKDDSSSINILVNVNVLTTGFDSPNIDCVFISRPVTSIILYSQMIGRGIRGPRMGGNENCKLVEVVDNLDFGDESWAFNFFDSYWSL
ncbi:MAG: DEAD/DEAH box helicase [Candidatus Brocadiales bacterium]|nr:DEAD/DEAH box helicase [Candidatus Brocadiales bacterium]